jgi:hypothetical protein
MSAVQTCEDALHIQAKPLKAAAPKMIRADVTIMVGESTSRPARFVDAVDRGLAARGTIAL